MSALFSRRIRSAASLLLLAAPLLAGAQDADRLKSMIEHAKERFTAADTDHDGSLTKAEAEKGMPFVAKHFDQIDAAKSGKVSLADITKFMEARRAEAMAPPADAKKD